MPIVHVDVWEGFGQKYAKWSVLRTGLVLRTLGRRQGCKYSKLFLEDATA
jgi:hypothetical protein